MEETEMILINKSWNYYWNCFILINFFKKNNELIFWNQVLEHGNNITLLDHYHQIKWVFSILSRYAIQIIKFNHLSNLHKAY